MPTLDEMSAARDGQRDRAAVPVGRIAAERLRAILHRLSGADIGPKCLFGPRVRFDHPRQVHIGRRAQLEADVWLKLVSPSARVSVGDYAFLGRGVEVDAAERVTLGAHVLVAPGVFITDHDHNIGPQGRIDEQGCTSRPVVIGDDVWLGVRAIILPGVTIGSGAVVGAGAVVREDVPPRTIVAGVPARRIGSR